MITNTMPAESPISYFKSVFTENYANFSGRARRAEYWWFTLIYVAVIIGAAVVAPLLGTAGVILFLGIVLVALVPSTAVTVRRLHDTGRSGWWLLISFVPVASLVLLFFAINDGHRHSNEWGPSPKYVA